MNPYNQGYAEFSNIIIGQKNLNTINTNNISAQYNKTFQEDKKKYFKTSLVLSIVSIIIILSEMLLEIRFAPYFIMVVTIWSIATGVISIVEAKDKRAIIPIIVSLACLILSFVLYMY